METSPAETKPLILASYNIKSGVIVAHQLSRIAEVLRSCNADLIALQEVEQNTKGSGVVDQTKEIADLLGMQHVFYPALKRGGGYYGIALLVKGQLLFSERLPLPFSLSLPIEARIAINAVVQVGNEELRVVTTHVDWTPTGANKQLAALAELLKARGYIGRGLVLLGDLNAGSDSQGMRGLVQLGLVDAVPRYDQTTTRPSLFAKQLDHILLDAPLAARLIAGGVMKEATASDHKPIWVALRAQS